MAAFVSLPFPVVGGSNGRRGLLSFPIARACHAFHAVMCASTSFALKRMAASSRIAGLRRSAGVRRFTIASSASYSASTRLMTLARVCRTRRLARAGADPLELAVALEVAVRPGLPLIGVVLAAVVGAAVLGPGLVDAALHVLQVEGVARDHRLAAVRLLGPADHVDVGAALEGDRPDVGQPEPAVLILHELPTAAWSLAAGAVGVFLDAGHCRSGSPL